MITAGEVGERGLIDLMLKHFTPMPGALVPFWDDVMAISLSDGRAFIINTDMLVWETDVPRGMTPYQAARKAVIMNFSDLGAKGVSPQAFLSSIGIPRDIEAEAVEEMAQGFEDATREHGGYVIGGDTNEASEIIISGIALGVVTEDKIIKRDGARPGDLLATTGSFGSTSAAFKILLEGLEAPEGLRETLVESVYAPKARIKEGVALSESGVITSSIDSSDGLALSLYDLARSSRIGFKLENLPVSPEAEAFAEFHDIDPSDLALYGGEEYELVFTVPEEGLAVARSALAGVGCELLELGVVTTEMGIVRVVGGEIKPVKRGGWEHFTGA